MHRHGTGGGLRDGRVELTLLEHAAVAQQARRTCASLTLKPGRAVQRAQRITPIHWSECQTPPVSFPTGYSWPSITWTRHGSSRSGVKISARHSCGRIRPSRPAPARRACPEAARRPSSRPAPEPSSRGHEDRVVRLGPNAQLMRGCRFAGPGLGGVRRSVPSPARPSRHEADEGRVPRAPPRIDVRATETSVVPRSRRRVQRASPRAMRDRVTVGRPCRSDPEQGASHRARARRFRRRPRARQARRAAASVQARTPEPAPRRERSCSACVEWLTSPIAAAWIGEHQQREHEPAQEPLHSVTARPASAAS